MIATAPTIVLHAGLPSLLAAGLTANVIFTRVQSGDGGVAGLARALRAHGNFIEQAPIALLAIGAAEAAGARPLVVTILGVALVVARLAATYALNRSIDQSPPRQFAGGLSVMVLLAAGAAALLAAFGVR